MTQFKNLTAEDAQATVYLDSSGFLKDEAVAKINVLIDSKVPLNAYDIELSYDPARLTIDRVDTSDSLVTILQQPVSVVSGRILIRGGSTKQFSGSGGNILTLYVRARTAGSSDLDFLHAKFYQADGLGTLAVTAVRGAVISADDENVAYAKQIALSPDEPTAVIDLAASDRPVDTTPPSIAKVDVLSNPFDGSVKLFVFDASDDLSSIAMSRVRTRSGLSWEPWQEAVSPHPVANQAWAVQLEVIDGAGNIASQTLYRAAPIPLIVLITVLAVAFILWIKFSARRRANNDIIDSK